MNLKGKDSLSPATILLLLLIAALYSLLSFWTPVALDDWMFMDEWERINGKGAGPGLRAFYEFWKEIRLYDNGRLANVLSPMSVMFSPWKEIFPVLTGMCCAFIVGAGCRVAFPGRRFSPLNVAAMWAATLYFLPWRNGLFVADYSLNYIWASAVTFVFILYVIRMERRGWSLSSFIGALLLALVAGAWHEGFAFATLGGFIMLTFSRRRRHSFQWWAVGVFYAAVTIAVFYCPGMMLRASQQLGVGTPGGSLVKTVVDFLPVIFLVALLVIFGAVPSLRRFLGEAWGNDWFVLGWGTVIIGTLLSLIITHQPRSAFWPDLWAIIMIFILFRSLWERIGSGRFAGYLTALAAAAAFTPLAFALVVQHSLYTESREIFAKIERSDTGTVYHDIIPSGRMSVYALKIPTHALWVTGFHYKTLGDYTGKPFPAVVPLNLQGLHTVSHGTPLEGNAGALKLADSVVLPVHKYERPEVVPVEVVLQGGDSVATTALMLPFVSDKGENLTYVVPYYVPSAEIVSLNL